MIETATGTKHRFEMANSAQDFELLIQFIQSLGGRCQGALEPTGDYHRPIAHRLLMAGVDLVSVSSVAQARYREAGFNSWDKNDPKDGPPGPADKSDPHAEAISKASGLTPPRWLWRRVRHL